MSLQTMTDEQIETKLDFVERMLGKVDDKDLPLWNAMFQKLLDEQVRRDMEKSSRANLRGRERKASK